MKLLTLNVIDVDNVTAEYDFTSGAVKKPEEALRFLEYALFGNDVLFSGKIILTAENEGETYRVERDFAGETEIYRDGYRLGEKKSAKVLQSLAGLKQSQWKATAQPLNVTEFMENVDGFIKNYLNELGFDAEEMEKRWELYYKDHSLYVSKVEAYDELVDDTYVAIVADKRQKLRVLQEQFDIAAAAKQSAEGKSIVLSMKRELEEKKAALENNEKDVAGKRAELNEDEAKRQRLSKLYDAKEIQKLRDETVEKLNGVVSEMEALQAAMGEKQSELQKNKEAAELSGAKAAGLRDSFETIIKSNLEDGELTGAVIYKTESVAAALSEGQPDPAADLQEAHYDYRKRRALREGVAFENSIDNSELRVKDLTEKIEQNSALIESIQKELDANEGYDVELDPETENERAERLSVAEARYAANNLEKEIALLEKKIRELLKERKSRLENIGALKKARIAQDEYIRRCLVRKEKLDAKLLESRSKIAFNANKREMEIGDPCPICKGRITNKNEVNAELSKLGEGYDRLLADSEENERLLKEAQEKSASIDVRLAQFVERNDLAVAAINGLTESVNEKKKRLSSLLLGFGATTVADLERKLRAMPVEESGASKQEHIDFLKARMEEISATVEKDKAALAEEQERLDAMKADYEKELAPELGGKPAMDSLDAIVENDILEDSLIAQINDKSMSEIENEKIDMYVNVTAEIFADVMNAIKEAEDGKENSLKLCDELATEIDGLEARFKEFERVADDLKAQADEADAALNGLLAEIACTEETDPADLEKELLGDEARENLTSYVEQYDRELEMLTIQIDALGGYKPVIYDTEAYAELQQKVDEAEKAYDKAATRLAVSEAAKGLAYEKAMVCETLTLKMNELKKLTDGEITEVVMPIVDEVLKSVEDEAEARPDGTGIGFFKTNSKKVKRVEPDKNALTVMASCAINYVMTLVTGESTTGFAVVTGKNEELKTVAEKYGVVLL